VIRYATGVTVLILTRFFGRAGTPYDFSGVNLAQARDQCRELETAHKGMGRKINTKVMNMIDKWVFAFHFFTKHDIKE
jgi:hypothetical protein